MPGAMPQSAASARQSGPPGRSDLKDWLVRMDCTYFSQAEWSLRCPLLPSKTGICMSHSATCGARISLRKLGRLAKRPCSKGALARNPSRCPKTVDREYDARCFTEGAPVLKLCRAYQGQGEGRAGAGGLWGQSGVGEKGRRADGDRATERQRDNIRGGNRS